MMNNFIFSIYNNKLFFYFFLTIDSLRMTSFVKKSKVVRDIRFESNFSVLQIK